jgi:hypothetical protein
MAIAVMRVFENNIYILMESEHDNYVAILEKT